jgi:hypothetical protein
MGIGAILPLLSPPFRPDSLILGHFLRMTAMFDPRSDGQARPLTALLALFAI